MIKSTNTYAVSIIKLSTLITSKSHTIWRMLYIQILYIHVHVSEEIIL